jgi:ABC-type nitrate/sulfonate/bicarbonate transport system ATPase subunit
LPGRVIEITDVDLPRPRDRRSKSFHQLKHEILKTMIEG